jgi:hypothetical protein
MFKLIAAVGAAAALFALGPAGAWSRGAADTLCVGDKPGCYATIQAALDAAHDGDTIRVGPGSFAGGITIDKSVDLVGAGAKATVINGGGPVVTIGEFLGTSELTVTISGVTVTRGVTTSSPLSTEWTGEENVIALGGGIAIEPREGYSTGATVTIRDSIITGNRAAPSETVPSHNATCPSGPCPFAWAKGGGIDNWGRLTLSNSSVSDNIAAGAASDAIGGGINNWWPATLAVSNSQVNGNRAIASVPNGRFAEGGGIFDDPGVPLTISTSGVNDNTASLTSTFPFDVGGGDTLDMNTNGGGIHADDDSTVTIENTELNGNTVSVDDSNGEPYAFDAALHPGSGPLVLSNVTMADNHVIATVASTADVGPSGSAIDIVGASTVTDVRITGNTTTVTSGSGTAGANGAVYAGSTAQPAVITNSVIRGNSVKASSTGGPAVVLGGGLVNDGLLTLRNVLVSDNVGLASGPTGFARGGGIWNGSLFNSPPIELTLENTNVMHNTLSASPGLTVQGGGMFTAFPVTLSNGRIANNSPDQCYGC